MNRKVFIVILIFCAFLFFSKEKILAAGTCKCKSIPIGTAPNSPAFCISDPAFTATCSEGTMPKCIAGEGGNGCGSGNACECQSTSEGGPQGGPEQQPGNGETVTIPRYPTPVGGTAGFLISPNLTVGEIIGKALTYIYVIAGIALLLVLIMGGISLMTAAGDPKKIEAGYGKIKDALIGFLIIFISYIATQLVEVVLGVKIL